MSKYHINKKGVPSLCKAEKGGCPFGTHYDTKEEASNEYDKKMSEEHGILPAASKASLSISERKSFSSLIERISSVKSAGFDYECYASLSLADDMGLDTVSILDDNGMAVTLPIGNTSREIVGSAEYIDRSVEALSSYYKRRGIIIKNENSLARVIYFSSKDPNEGVLVQSGGPNVLDAAIVKADEVVDIVEIKKLSSGAQLPSKTLEIDKYGDIKESDLSQQKDYMREAIKHININDADGKNVQVDFGDAERNIRFPLHHFVEEYKSKGATAFVYTTDNGEKVHKVDLTGDTEDVIDDLINRNIEADVVLRANLSRQNVTEDDIYRFNNIVSKKYSKSRRSSTTDTFTLKSIDESKIARAGDKVRIGSFILPIKYDDYKDNLNKRIKKEDLVSFKLTITGKIRTNYN